MNKKIIDDLIPRAYKALEEFGVAARNKKTNALEIDKTFRGYISSFGAAVAMGSLKAAVAFYSQQNKAMKDRDTLIKIIYALITGSRSDEITQTSLFEYIEDKISKGKESEVKEEIYNAAIAVKLAMNLYKLV